jgi:hypothetical protein
MGVMLHGQVAQALQFVRTGQEQLGARRFRGIAQDGAQVADGVFQPPLVGGDAGAQQQCLLVAGILLQHLADQLLRRGLVLVRDVIGGIGAARPQAGTLVVARGHHFLPQGDGGLLVLLLQAQ